MREEVFIVENTLKWIWFSARCAAAANANLRNYYDSVGKGKGASSHVIQ